MKRMIFTVALAIGSLLLGACTTTAEPGPLADPAEPEVNAAAPGPTGTLSDSTTTSSKPSSTRTARPSSTRTARPSSTTSPRATDARKSSGQAPIGETKVGVWWYPAPDAYSAANLWFFDPVNEAKPYGWRRGYQPAGTITPSQMQHSFTFTQSGTNLKLSYPTGSRQKLKVLKYDSGRDILTVNWEGYVQRWVGCRSGLMPAVAAAACR